MVAASQAISILMRYSTCSLAKVAWVVPLSKQALVLEAEWEAWVEWVACQTCLLFQQVEEETQAMKICSKPLVILLVVDWEDSHFLLWEAGFQELRDSEEVNRGKILNKRNEEYSQK